MRAALSGLLEGQVAIAIEALADIAQNGTSESARVSAACAILDRTHGRPRAALKPRHCTGYPPACSILSSATGKARGLSLMQAFSDTLKGGIAAP